MPRYVCFPVVEPPGSGGLGCIEGCLGQILGIFMIGAIICSVIYNMLGIGRSPSNVSQPAQVVSPRSQNNSDSYNVQPPQATEKHLGHHSAHKVREVDFQPTHHNRVRISEYNGNSETSEANSLHGNIRYHARSQDQHGHSHSESSSDASVGDLHSDNGIGNSSSGNDSNESSSSSTDISGGLH